MENLRNTFFVPLFNVQLGRFLHFATFFLLLLQTSYASETFYLNYFG